MKLGSLVKLTTVSLVIALFLTIFLSGCQSTPLGQIEVRVVVTQDFSQERMRDKLVTLDDVSTAMDVLQQVAIVETKYRGGFV